MIHGLPGYSFLTKSAKLKRYLYQGPEEEGYSFLTKSAKLKQSMMRNGFLTSYSFLTKSAKLKPFWSFAGMGSGYSFLTKSAKLKRTIHAPPLLIIRLCMADCKYLGITGFSLLEYLHSA